MQISLLHTAQSHIDTFEAQFAGSGAQLMHHVAPELLAKAQSKGMNGVRRETHARLTDLAKAGTVLCTCSTLGPLVDELNQPNILRIDRPMMEAACKFAPNILVALCLESTKTPTLELLNNCAENLNLAIDPQIISIPEAWSYFQGGDLHAYAQSICNVIRQEISDKTNCIVLAQASMALACDPLSDLGLPVLTSPPLAVARALQISGA